MAPRLSLFTARSVPFRTKPTIPQKRFAPAPSSLLQQRAASDNAASSKDDQSPKKTPLHPQAKGPTEDQLPHVTEEAVAIDKSMGNTPPDVEQGTPVQEIFKRDKDAQDKAPQVFKQDLKQDSSTSSNNKPPSGTRSFSTAARRNASEVEAVPNSGESWLDHLVQFQDTRVVGLEYPDAGFGHKFGLPDLKPLGKAVNFKRRYDPVVEQVTRSLMRDGKLSRAQKVRIVVIVPSPQCAKKKCCTQNMQFILDALRTSSAPPTNKDLISPLPMQSLPLSPVVYLTAIIDSVAPLVKIRQQRGLLGGGASMPIPVPLRLRQRRRTAIQWILTAADGRREDKLAERVAKELLGVAEGRSSAWEKRARIHKMAISARANVKIAANGRRTRTKSIRGK
ncbi:uncharacterized protein Z520_04056 [Fonsecaea multimorphosa CBS 102226]|uniref:Small ribosomal subunit protein uS7 domain-containing protein n=1 Tax=Fonsecaea multimorphosa CBS 102226 TaxID=1442371 RepID=A0A0D2HES1_9EURO|nr:uncharacterized protein Z520_04056 [Fonsecaea multimorphosa CBS 102226]KIY00371.1 hypothetical protein Z520_04056 [Fonsecaea multimorphosa CBS 102226]OAL27202.1 hypothetical protein AYO22_03833 [Fonsecaea multimorphosa]